MDYMAQTGLVSANGFYHHTEISKIQETKYVEMLSGRVRKKMHGICVKQNSHIGKIPRRSLACCSHFSKWIIL